MYLKVHKYKQYKELVLHTYTHTHKKENNWTVLYCNCVSASILPHTHTHTALGQGDSGSSEPAVTCRSRCSGKPLLTATIDDLIKLSPRRSAAGGGEVGVARVCRGVSGSGVRAGGGEYPGGLVHAYR